MLDIDSSNVDSASSDDESVEDECEAFISFQSIRDPYTHLEKSISFSWPGVWEDDTDDSSSVRCITSRVENTSADNQSSRRPRTIVLSTLLEENDIAPIFDGSRWAGTRLWGAAVRAIQYIAGHLDVKLDFQASLNYHYRDEESNGCKLRLSMIELGCGLGVPGMIYHMLGGTVVLTDQANILSQLEKNIKSNFPQTAIPTFGINRWNDHHCDLNKKDYTIQALPLSWSREGISELLQKLNRTKMGFDIILNCDCVYEPLYGKSWKNLNETINELLRINPHSVVVTSVERRQDDGIDDFLECMRNSEFVRSVDLMWEEKGRNIQIHVTRGIT